MGRNVFVRPPPNLRCTVVDGGVAAAVVAVLFVAMLPNGVLLLGRTLKVVVP